MTPLTIGLISIGAVLLLIAIRVPIALAMAVAGIVGFGSAVGWQAAFAVAQQAPMEVLANYNFTPIPLFILMGAVAFQSGISTALFDAARSLFGGRRGGAAYAAMTASASFAAISGSSLACVATIGRVALPEMKRFGYDLRLASGVLASGGTLGILIPPSIPLLLYALVTEQSVGDLFIAGVLPGLLGFVLYIATTTILVWRHPDWAPAGPRTTWRQKLKDSRGALAFILLFAFVVGGLYGGFFTPTEAAAVGAGAATLLSFGRGMRLKGLIDAVAETLVISAMIYFLLIGTQIFGFLLSVSRVGYAAADLIAQWDLSPVAIILIVVVLFLALGTVLDGLAMMLLTVPVLFPIITAAGYDPVWFGVFCVITIELALISPPVGMNVFVMKSLDPELRLHTVFSAVMPFLMTDIIRLLLLVAFPVIALLLV